MRTIIETIWEQCPVPPDLGVESQQARLYLEYKYEALASGFTEAEAEAYAEGMVEL